MIYPRCAGIRVAQLRTIFRVPEQYERALFGREPPDHLAYVEWFTAPPSQTNAVNGMFPVRREFQASGARSFGIVEVVDIRRACQLFPNFGSRSVDRSLTPKTIIDAYDDFYLNNRLDKDAYRSIHWESTDDAED